MQDKLEKVVRVPTTGMKNDGCKMPSHCLAIEGSRGTPQTENPTTKQFYSVGRGSECGLLVWLLTVQVLRVRGEERREA